jgi:hypothetical protein
VGVGDLVSGHLGEGLLELLCDGLELLLLGHQLVLQPVNLRNSNSWLTFPLTGQGSILNT